MRTYVWIVPNWTWQQSMAKSTEHRVRAVSYVGETHILPWYAFKAKLSWLPHISGVEDGGGSKKVQTSACRITSFEFITLSSISDDGFPLAMQVSQTRRRSHRPLAKQTPLSRRYAKKSFVCMIMCVESKQSIVTVGVHTQSWPNSVRLDVSAMLLVLTPSTLVVESW